jgi:hypothetical protein
MGFGMERATRNSVTSGLRGHKIMTVIRTKMVTCLMSLCLIVAVVQPTVDVYADRQDTISEVERVLKQAATESQHQPHRPCLH